MLIFNSLKARTGFLVWAAKVGKRFGTEKHYFNMLYGNQMRWFSSFDLVD